jgi:beta-N-acetylhexosaminidase
MLGHMVVSDVSDLPVIFSYTIVTEVLREELGFEGVVMTDALEMKAIRDNYTSGEASLKCIDAGVDIILCPIDFNDAITTVENAVNSGRITEERLDESVRRILQAKINMGLIPETGP